MEYWRFWFAPGFLILIIASEFEAEAEVDVAASQTTVDISETAPVNAFAI